MTPAPPPQSTRLSVLIPFAIVTLIWGSTWIVIRDQLGVVPASWSVAYRFVIAGVAMLGWAAWRGESLRLPGRGLAFAAVLGMLQFCMNFNFVYRAEAHITSGLVAVIFALLLVPNATLARIFLGQRMGRQLVIGSVVAIVGVALLFVHEARVDPSGGTELALGIGFTFAAILSASSANVMQAAPVARDFPLASLLGIAMLMGAGYDALFAWATVGPPVIEWRWTYWAGVVYLGVFATAVAFPLYFGVIRTIGPAKAAYSSVMLPVIAMALSTMFEGYRWSLLAAAGALIVAVGLVIALTARRPNR